MDCKRKADDVSTESENPNPRRSRRPRILFAVTGSVAAVKGPEIAVRLVTECNCDVRILLTRGGENFWNKAEAYDTHYWDYHLEILKGAPENLSVVYADDEWKEWQKLGDPVLHIDLRDWADMVLVAPLSAHTLAKIANGFCDDTLSCVIRAWDFGHGPRPGKPILLAPAMNTAMWEHPLTQTQLSTIQSFWNNTRRDPGHRVDNAKMVKIIAPQVKTLACGELGNGALAAVNDIVGAVEEVKKLING